MAPSAETRLAEHFASTIGWRLDLDRFRNVSFAPPSGEERAGSGDLPAEADERKTAALSEASRVLLGVLALKFQVFLGLSEEATQEVMRLLVEFDEEKKRESAAGLLPSSTTTNNQVLVATSSGDVRAAHTALDLNYKRVAGLRSGARPLLGRTESDSVAKPDPPPQQLSESSTEEGAVVDGKKPLLVKDADEKTSVKKNDRSQATLSASSFAGTESSRPPRAKLLTSTTRRPKSIAEDIDESFLDHAVPQTEAFMLAMSSLSHIAALRLPDLFLNLYFCIRATNIIILSVRRGDQSGLESVLGYLNEPLQRGKYCTGAIRQKEPHVYLFEGGSSAAIQVGIPPETIKTSMRAGEAIPQVYVLPSTLFSGDVNYAEVEFPIYFNYFIKKAFLDRKNRIILVGDESDLEKVRCVFRESFYGPKDDQMFVDEEICAEAKERGYKVNLGAERATLAAKGPDGNPVPLDDFVNCVPFQPTGQPGKKDADIEVRRASDGDSAMSDEFVPIKIVNEHGMIQFWENGMKLASVDTNVYAHAHSCLDLRHKSEVTTHSTEQYQYLERNSALHPDNHDHSRDAEIRSSFEAPTFGVTFLGTSHGFDAKGHTTGFIVWINGEGVCVDPPPFTSKYLRENGVPSASVRTLILTHCHSDHDSGLMTKILDGERAELLTTKTVHESYCRKVNAVTGLDAKDFYDFTPVPIGRPIKVLGADFEFDYSFHTIPTVRFKVRYAGRCISYSADTYFETKFYGQLREQGVINAQREASLNYFLWDADLIIHESGVAPIHTPLSVLNDLPTATKNKMVIVHCNSIPNSYEEDVEHVDAEGETIKTKRTVQITGLHIPETGLEHTLRVDVGSFEEGRSHAMRRFKRFANIFAFRGLSPAALYALFLAATESHFNAGDIVVRHNDPADKFYVVHTGKLEVLKPPSLVRSPSGLNAGSHAAAENVIVATLRAGDSFGEAALRQVVGIPRNATVRAVVSSIVLSVHSADFNQILSRSVTAAAEIAASAFDEPHGVTLSQHLTRIARMRPLVKEVLGQTYLFSNLTEDQAVFIASILKPEAFFEAGETIIFENDLNASLFVIHEGKVQLEARDHSGEARPFMRLGAGSLFGEMSVLTGLPRTCTVIATERTSVLELDKHSFDLLMIKYPALRVKMAQLVEERVRSSDSVQAMFRKSGTIAQT